MSEEQIQASVDGLPRRTAISKKLRFEVFKRDSFACVYCGQSAPTVILQIDHLRPVAIGGGNDILNLATACADCNSGKGARELSDQTTVSKQRANLEELNERRIQLEMLLEWRESLADLAAAKITAVKDAIAAQTAGEIVVSEKGELHIRRWLKKYSLPELLEAVDTAFERNLVLGGSDSALNKSWQTSFHNVPRVASVNQASKDKPWLKDALYIRGILRVRADNGDLDEYYYGDALDLIAAAIQAGASIESLKEFAKSTTVWDKFVTEINRFCEAQKSRPAEAAPAMHPEGLAEYSDREDQWREDELHWHDERQYVREPAHDFPELADGFDFPELRKLEPD
jgi:hypothetical protein